MDKYSLEQKDEQPKLPATIEETTEKVQELYERSFDFTLEAARLITAADMLRKHATNLAIKEAENGG